MTEEKKPVRKKKELSVDEHNKLVAEKVAKLEHELAEARKEFKSEATKPQRSLAECNAINRKIKFKK